MAQYKHTHKGRQEHAEECVRLANDRARLEIALWQVLGLLGFDKREVKEMSDAARAGDFDWLPDRVVPTLLAREET